MATAVGSVSNVGSNIYHYLPTQAELSVAGRAVLTFSKVGYQRAYEMIQVKGPTFPASPIYSEVVVSTTGSRVPFRLYAADTRLPAADVSVSANDLFIGAAFAPYVTAGGTVSAMGNVDYAYVVTTADVSLTGPNILQVRKPGYWSEGAIFNVYTSLNATGGTLNVNVLSVTPTLTVNVASVAPGAIGVSAITSAAYEQAADSLLSRRVKPGASNTRTVSEALAGLRNRVVRTETGYAVYDVDDTSIIYSGSLTTSLSSSPIVEMNPV
jgi:hypothetical protein